MGFAIQVAKNVAELLLTNERTTERQARALAKAIEGIESIPNPTEGLCCEFGVSYRNGDADFSEMRYISFRISDIDLCISRGGSVYDKFVGSDSFSDPDCLISFDGEQREGFDLYGVEDSVAEYLNLGAEIQASDDSDESDDDE